MEQKVREIKRRRELEEREKKKEREIETSISSRGCAPSHDSCEGLWFLFVLNIAHEANLPPV